MCRVRSPPSRNSPGERQGDVLHNALGESNVHTLTNIKFSIRFFLSVFLEYFIIVTNEGNFEKTELNLHVAFAYIL